MTGRSRIRTALAGERIAIWGLGLLVIGISLLVGFAGTPHVAPEGSVDRVAATPGVTVTETSGGYAIRPVGTDADTGLVFYPGARVEPSAYVPMLAPVVEETGTAVFVPQPRLNLAVFEPRMATAIADSNPAIANWYVGGHSLGGAMACRYAADHADHVDGLVLFGAYCERSIADSELRVLAVGGTRDTVLGTDRSALRPETLPASATIHQIAGLNHTQFGSYSGQSGDSPATISRETAHERLQSVLIDFLRETR